MAVSTNVTDVSVASRFREMATLRPDTPALVSSHARLSYRELDLWSDQVAADILALELPTDAPVAIAMRSQVPTVPAILGALKAGHFFALIDPSDSDARIENALESTGTRACLVDEPSAVASKRRISLQVNEMRDVAITPPKTKANELLQVAFTAGSTGIPKAARRSQRAYAAALVRMAKYTGRDADRRVSFTALPGHTRASSEILGSLLNGATLCAFDPRTEQLDVLVGMIERERVSILTLTPVLFRRLVRTLPDSVDLSSVQKLRLGADVVTMFDVEAWRRRFPVSTVLERSYSSTETGKVLQLDIAHGTPIPGPLVPIGRPLPDVDARVVDEEGNDVAVGETGELVVTSPLVVHGYWNDPDLTAEKFTFDPDRLETPTFRTGDLVKRDEEGLFYFVGRLDSRLKVHGHRIDPIEIESVLIQNAGLQEAVVVSEFGSDGESHLAAWVIPLGPAAEPRAIRSAVRGKIPHWMIPARIYVVESLPQTSRGKVDRRALMNRDVPDTRQQLPDTTDESTVEEAVTAIWSHVLRMPVNAADDFFLDLGGTSLAALEIVAEISRRLGRSLPLSLLLQLNTVRKLSGYLDAKLETHRTVIALRREGSLPPLFCVSGKGGSVIAFRALAEALGDEQPLFGITHHGIDSDSLPTTLASIAACYVDAIQKEQPAGPYYLAGYSAGGYIAWEIARQLSHAGHAIAFVGLFDTTASRIRAPRWKRSLKYAAIFRQNPVASTVRFAGAFVRRIGWAAQWAISGGTKSFVPKLEANRFYDSLNMREALQPYSGPVTLFRARHGSGADCPLPDNGWGTLCRDEVSVVEIDGEHETILTRDVASLAGGLSNALAKARTRAADAQDPSDR